MGRAAESSLAFVGNAIVNLISSIAQDIASGDAAYKNCLQNDGTFCGPSSLEGNFFYENCMRNGGSPVLCDHLR